jgi:hypothetical protein
VALQESVAPHPDDDDMIATGDELQELLAERRVLFLFYAGFTTNVCVLEGAEHVAPAPVRGSAIERPGGRLGADEAERSSPFPPAR